MGSAFSFPPRSCFPRFSCFLVWTRTTSGLRPGCGPFIAARCCLGAGRCSHITCSPCPALVKPLIPAGGALAAAWGQRPLPSSQWPRCRVSAVKEQELQPCTSQQWRSPWDAPWALVCARVWQRKKGAHGRGHVCPLPTAPWGRGTEGSPLLPAPPSTGSRHKARLTLYLLSPP